MQLNNLTKKLEEIEKKLDVIQKDMLILRAHFSKPQDPWNSGFSLGDK